MLDAELKKCTPPLDSRDAAFAARIFYTTLERLPLLDYRINQFTKKPVAKLDAPVRAVLRAGLALLTKVLSCTALEPRCKPLAASILVCTVFFTVLYA